MSLETEKNREVWNMESVKEWEKSRGQSRGSCGVLRDDQEVSSSRSIRSEHAAHGNKKAEPGGWFRIGQEGPQMGGQFV